jgi:hypothetical protein
MVSNRHQHPPLHPSTLSVCWDTGKGEGEELNQREGRRGNSSQSWVENTNITDSISIVQSINSDKHLSQSPFTVQYL